MTILNIVLYPQKILTTKTEPITDVNEEIINIANDMLETMYYNNGIGLAANQVNINKQLIVIDLQIDDYKEPIFMINPKIITNSKDMFTYEEGCLSIPGIKTNIERSAEIIVEFLNLNAELTTITAQNLLSTCIQHEIDHLVGKLFIEKVSTLKRNLLLKQYNKKLKESS